MTISLSPETEKLLRERMSQGGFSSADDAILAALRTLGSTEGEALEDLDAQTLAAIERGEAQANRGEGRAWEDVRDELRSRFT